MPVVVSDTSPVRALGFIDHLDLLAQLFGEVLIPPAVVQELSLPSGAFQPLFASEINKLRIISPTDRAQVPAFRQELDAGESEALALAIEVHAEVVLIDEKGVVASLFARG